MARKLTQKFFAWLQKPVGSQILSTIAQYRCLSLAMDGTSLRVYFQGCKILSIKHNKISDLCCLTPLSNQYIKTSEPVLESIINSGITQDNLQNYLDLAIGLISRRDNKRQEERIRQEIATVNNCSREANDTDFFVVDQEYGVTVEGKTSKFDLVTVKWLSEPEQRKNFKKSNIEIVIFELKLGKGAVGGTINATSESADLKSHIRDFSNFQKDSVQLSKFKEDIITMFVQQACLTGFFNSKINGLKHVKELKTDDKTIKLLAENVPVKFGFIIADYKQKSTTLTEQISQFHNDFVFATSSFMGYGLYENCILNREQLIEKLK